MCEDQTPAEKSALPFTQRELIQKLIDRLPEKLALEHPRPLWSLVHELIGGSTHTARLVCWRYGFDPDEIDLVAYQKSLAQRELDDGK